MKNEIRTTKKEMNLANNLRFEHETREIIITKRMEAAASKFGSEAYNYLIAARADYPDYKLVVKTVAKSATRITLNCAFMVKYIEKHDDENKTVMAAYEAEKKKMKKKDDTELADNYSFGNLRKWFLEKYPEVKNYIENTKKAA